MLLKAARNEHIQCVCVCLACWGN